MSWLDGLKRKMIGKAAAHAARSSREHATGKARQVLNVLDGWKSVIVLLGFVAKSLWPDWPLWYAVDAVVHGLGWDEEAPLIDPNTVAVIVAAGIPVVHFLMKRWKEWRAGIPVADLGRSPLDQTVALVTPNTELIVDKTEEQQLMGGPVPILADPPKEVALA